MKEIFFGNDSQSKIIEGMQLLAKAVCCTLGPSGRNVMIRDIYRNPVMTKDGVTVAKAVQSDDPTINAGIQLLRTASQKIADDVGDGSTTVVLMAMTMIESYLKTVKEIGNNKSIIPTNVKKGMDMAAKNAVRLIRQMGRSIKNNKRLMQAIATISANNDEFIGKLVCDAMSGISKDGAVTIESSINGESYVDTIMGMRFDRGMESQHFANNEFGNECELEACSLIMIKGKVDDMQAFIKILEPAINLGQPVCVIADDYSLDIINALALNKMKNGFKLCAIKAPSFGEQRIHMMEDIAVLTGGKYIGMPNTPIEEFDISWLGRCDKITVTKNDTTIVGGAGDEEEIDNLVRKLQELYDNEEDKKTKANYRDRLLKLNGGVSIIYVGGQSEAEISERKDRVDDAVCAVRAAVRDGVVAGGGSTYVKVFNELSDSERINKLDFENDDVKLGYTIVLSALLSPLIQLINNGYHEIDIHDAVSYISDTDKENNRAIRGYNFKTGTPVEDMFKEGIVDPLSVSTDAILNSVSIVSMVIMTECSIVDYTDMAKTNQQ